MDAYDSGWAYLRAFPGTAVTPAKKTNTRAELLDEYVAAQRRRYEHGLKFPNAPQEDRISPMRCIGYQNGADKMKAVWGDVANDGCSITIS